MKNKLHFLSGIPYSGSTLLSAILNQNPQTHVSTTSGLVHSLIGLANTWQSNEILRYNDDEYKKLIQSMRGMIDICYEDIDKPVIIDKSRGWIGPNIMRSVSRVIDDQFKMIVTVRFLPDCVAELVNFAKPNNLDEFIELDESIENLKSTYISLEKVYKHKPDNFLIVEYEDLIKNPKTQLNRIHKFLELPPFEYDFNNIDGSKVLKDDENLFNTDEFHDIKPVLAKQKDVNSKDVLKHNYIPFCQPEFWLDQPRTIVEPHDIDLQLDAAIKGDFAEAWRLAEKLEKEEPNNPRAIFNRGWYYLRQNQVQKGYQLMDAGRVVGVFGNSKPNLSTPHWDGKSKGIVLLYLEGGLGDQIHQVRYAKNIAQRGCKVIVACAGSLCSLFADVEGVSSVVQHEAAPGVHHNYWVAGMSAVVPLGFELSDLDGSAYISKPTSITGSKKRIGLRWQGNPDFENDHHKLFPFELMFSAIKDVDAEFISLQRDATIKKSCPNWVKTVPLDTWENTRKAIASCDLVISACTSVSHLSGAMGIPTWVILPVLPYFLYAKEGNKTPYYDSFTLFRQEQYGEWKAPFNKITQSLSVEPEKIRRIK
jgi:hypothetical protein